MTSYVIHLHTRDDSGERNGAVLEISRASGGEGFVNITLLRAEKSDAKAGKRKAVQQTELPELLGMFHVRELVQITNALVALNGGAQ